MSTLFISDLHLAPDTPAANETLLNFLQQTAPSADALYVLGDLFEYWIGDDGLEHPFARRIADAFRKLSDGGTPLYFMHGNRDFLIGSTMLRASGSSGASGPVRSPSCASHGCTFTKRTQPSGNSEQARAMRW